MLGTESDAPSVHSLPQNMSDSLEQIRSAFSSLQSLVTDDCSTRERLRRATGVLAERVDQVDSQGSVDVPLCPFISNSHIVTEHLRECILPSPPATLLLSSPRLLDIQDATVRFAMILRVMRYISFHPWGSIRADGDRRRAGIDRISNHLCHLWPSAEPAVLKKFTAGGGVLWSPVLYHPHKRLKPVIGPLGDLQQPEGTQIAWLASRMPPFFKNPQEGAGSASRLIVDITHQLHAADTKSDSHTTTLDVLYDCRFLVRFDLERMPKHVQAALRNVRHEPVSIKILPHTQYFWPKVVLQQGVGPDKVLAVLSDKGEVDTLGFPPWISMKWVRLLDAT